MPPFRVLHITDFHINDPTSEKENLRRGYYREFINGLIGKIKSVFGENPVDLILATGDFVEKNKSENYQYAADILQYFISKLNLTNNLIGTCPGNHDIDYKKDENDSKAAREAYNNFASTYGIKEVLISKDRYSLSKLNDEVYVLIIDNTLGSKGEKNPGLISIAEIDEIINEVIIDTVPPDKLLIIASHFPVNINSRSKLILEEDEWIKKHYWRSGIPFVSRVIDNRDVGPTLWLYGDSHSPDFFSTTSKHHFVMTGMIGGNHVDRSYTELDKDGKSIAKSFELQTEVKIIEFKSFEEDPIIHTFFYKRQGMVPSPSDGKWEHTESQTRPEQIIIPGSTLSLQIQASAVVHATTEAADNKTVVISSSVQKAIITRVTEEKLYNIGRFSISDNEVSLGWISINRLFEDYQILTQCVEKAIEWFDKISLDISNEDTILIGTDFWGSILASQLSVRTTLENLCLSTRGWGKNTGSSDSYISILKSIMLKKTLKKVVIITDVISSGRTVINLRDYLDEQFKKEGTIISKWVVVSIISDMKQKRSDHFDIFHDSGTFCGDIRMPIISSKELPDESILHPTLDYR